MSDDGWLRLVVDDHALSHNAACLRRHLPSRRRLLTVVKANGYGHGLVVAAKAFLRGGADSLGVHSVTEGLALRKAGIGAPILVLGPSTGSEMAAAARRSIELTIVSPEALVEAVAAAGWLRRPVRVHLKVETGVNRQGIVEGELDSMLALVASTDYLELVGLSSHFADIEDTTDHGFARTQADRFDAWRRRLAASGYPELTTHMSCSAAAILWPGADLDMARVGIAAYGIWPSRETLVSARAAGMDDLDLRPALSLHVRIAQVREVPVGETVGYGRTWQAPTLRTIAVLPVGYADGYPRALSGRAHVLVHGRRASVVGRVCMNLTMIDVTHISEVRAGDDAVLLGTQDDECIRAETLAEWLGTIPYEILVQPRASWTRTME